MKWRKDNQTVVGATFPGYTGVTEIATGGFATVYRAVESATSRPVALKVLRLADTSPRMVEAFNKELGALALLSNHPNVTTLYRTFYTAEGRPVLVLELCQESLAQRVRRVGPLGPAQVTEIGVKVAGALETAHRAGLLHRDMKPQNILFSQFGEPVLGDFGVAALQVSAQSTEGVFGFTTLHAPPEALEGQPLSASADIYGLASTMYQLLLGRGPFAAYEGEAPASVILRILRDPAPRPPAETVPMALADLLESALAKDPRKRPQTALDFAESLRSIEVAAGWPQTSYIVWGTSLAGGPSPRASAPARPAAPVAPAPELGRWPAPAAELVSVPAGWAPPDPAQRVAVDTVAMGPVDGGTAEATAHGGAADVGTADLGPGEMGTGAGLAAPVQPAPTGGRSVVMPTSTGRAVIAPGSERTAESQGSLPGPAQLEDAAPGTMDGAAPVAGPVTERNLWGQPGSDAPNTFVAWGDVLPTGPAYRSAMSGTSLLGDAPAEGPAYSDQRAQPLGHPQVVGSFAAPGPPLDGTDPNEGRPKGRKQLYIWLAVGAVVVIAGGTAAAVAAHVP